MTVLTADEGTHYRLTGGDIPREYNMGRGKVKWTGLLILAKKN